MATCAVIKGGVVVNMIVADPIRDPAPDDSFLIGNPPAFVTIGTMWNGGAFIAPPSQVSPASSAANAKMALL